MKIAIVSQYFPPDKPGRIADELSQELVARGHEVRVLTTYPHYGSATRRRTRESVDETRGEVLVRRVPILAGHSSNPLLRILNYASFALSARRANSFLGECDAVYVHGTPATAAYPAYTLRRKSGTPFVFHVQDIWPESVTGSGFLPKAVKRPVEAVINRWLRRVYASAGAVLAISPSAQDLFVARGAVPDRVHVVYNWASDETSAGRGEGVGQNAERSGGTSLRLIYAGNLGALQDLETVLRAVAAISDLPGVRLQIAGAGILESELRKLAAELALDNVIEFLGMVDREQVARLYAQADFQIVPLKALDIFGSNIPSKFQAGLSQDLPLITTVAGDLSRITEENGLGFTAVPEDVSSLESALRMAYATSIDQRAELRRAARQFYDKHLTKNSSVTQIETHLSEAVAGAHGRKNPQRLGKIRSSEGRRS